VRPSTVISWQRKRFRDHWTRLSRPGRPGRPRTAPEFRELIRKMSRANPSYVKLTTMSPARLRTIPANFTYPPTLHKKENVELHILPPGDRQTRVAAAGLIFVPPSLS
jgi:hypothetical protein